MKALTFDRFGGPEVLVYRDVADPIPTAGQALVRLRAIGLNFADVYRRQGHYHLAGDPPWIAGYEGSGEIISAPADSAFSVGDRVAFADAPFANAELVAVDVDRLIPLPDDIPHETAAALLLQGLTAQYLIRDSYSLRRDDTALVHAAAGGVGQLLVQLAKAAGARVIALASTEAKCDAARRAGADATSTYDGDWIARVQGFAANGIDVAFDSVGRTVHDSLRAVRTGGAVVFYGMAGGDPEPVDPRVLMDGSKTLTGGDLWNVLRTAHDRRTRAAELFDAVRRGDLDVSIDSRFALSDGAAAHAHLESRRALGKVLLIP
ncbi:quinone oxidoreductase family protein [Lysobacter claricitrinus]|uniref:quinone oxidoreductase family protein n=1 Tax=Lysobacter claricitrinus TaxID=3367728 RepID=UPI0037DAEE10